VVLKKKGGKSLISETLYVHM